MKRFVWLIAYCALFINCSKKVEEAVETKPEKGPVLVEMKPEAQEHVGLKVETATVKQLTEFLQVTGSVQPIDSRVSQVRSLARGRVQEVLTKVGDRVGNNQALVQIDNIEAGELLSQRGSARADLQRYQMRLVGIGAAAQKELELAQAEQQGLEQNVRSQESVVNGINSRFRRFGADEGSIRGLS